MTEQEMEGLKKQMRNTLNRAEVMFQELQTENENLEISLTEIKAEYKTMKGDYSQSLSTIQELQEKLSKQKPEYDLLMEFYTERAKFSTTQTIRLENVCEHYGEDEVMEIATKGEPRGDKTDWKDYVQLQAENERLKDVLKKIAGLVDWDTELYDIVKEALNAK